ncbi:MAG: M3 family oligoendopeptidase [Athalassotoga sp.]|uniref:M3 family oligoendopeptidase n=1 Tax=Athalassotoga sp. TaxID=2022597 RepID=UPI003CFD3229
MESGSENVVWNLGDLYSSVEDLKKDGEKLLEESKSFHQKFSDTQKVFEDRNLTRLSIDTLSDLYDKLGKISQYAYLRFAENTVADETKKILAWVENIETEVQSNLIFYNLAISKMPDELFEKVKPSITDYKHFLESSRRFKDHLFSEREEQLIVHKNSTGTNAFVKFYTQLTSTYRFRIKLDGKSQTINGSQLRSLRTHPDPKIREMVTSKLFKKYRSNALEIENAYNAVAKDYDVESKLRNYPSPISMRNLDNEVSDNVVETLVNVTTKNNSLVARYYKIKSKLMNQKLKLSDIYAPVGDVQRKFTWNEAKDIVRKAFYDFDERFGKIIDEFFEKRWIHASPMPAKEGGAFCSYSTPKTHPYVLLTFTGQIKDVMTLGHELGHGLHGVLSSKQNVLQYHTPLTMAETASTFAEMLLMDYFLEKLPKKEILPFIASKLEDLFATMNRQNMFTRFELRAHEKISKEGATFEELSDIYNEELHEMFGDSVEYNPEFRWEWSSVPHFFHTPFYCYAYDFAQLLVISLYAKYKSGMNNFKQKYVNLLSAGGSDSPEKLLEPFGISLSDPSFWQGGFDYIEENLLKRIERS